VGLDRLRVAWVGGAPVPPALLRWYRAIGIELREVYGLTECGGLATAVPAGRLMHGSVGAAVAHGEIALSTEGEVMVRGTHVCAGYWREPKATAALRRDGRLRTGDPGRIEAGMLTLTGVVFTGFACLLRAPEVGALIGKAIEQANARGPGPRRIARFRLIDLALTPEDPGLTPMMRLRRATVLARFQPLIEEMGRAA
jgi:long-subunit acyl-CoA synthetase (AMP-forming)